MQGNFMKTAYSGLRTVAISVFATALFVGGCASDSEEIPGPSDEYEKSTVKTEVPRCPSGYVLQCETKRVGRIRFSSIGKDIIESCSCEVYQGMPTQSPLPGIQ